MSQSVNLPLDHWGYNFLQRMETKGLFDSYELRVRPVPREKIADIVEQIYTRALANPELLSKTEWRMLDQLVGDFYDELQPRFDMPKRIRRERHLFKFSEGNAGLVYGDVVGSMSTILNKGRQYNPNELLGQGMLGGQLRGHIGSSIGFFAEARNTLTRGEEIEDESFNPENGSPIVTSGDNVFRDRATAYFTWDKSLLRLEGGRDEFDWGPSFRGGATLTKNSPPADNIRLAVRFNRFKLSYMHAWLRSGLATKYLAAHRLDVTVFKGLYLSATETVIYGDRNVEPSYLNPLMLYHVAEHHLGDKDNNNLAFDLTFTRLKNTTLYGEWFIDDMTSGKIGQNYFGNKWGWIFGAHVADPFKLKDVDLKAEYGRIDPYVYTHWDSLNIYTNYDKIIGHPLGPNAESIYLELGWQVNANFRIEVNGQRIRKAEGEANTKTYPVHGENKDFLKGLQEKRNLVGIRLIDQFRRDIFVELSYTYSDTQNLWLNEGATSYDHLARFHIYFNW
jgi:hypothetical protein